MTKLVVIASCLVLCGFVGYFTFCVFGNTHSQIENVRENSQNEAQFSCSAMSHENRFFDAEIFERTNDEVPAKRYYEVGSARGVIIPHHLLPGNIIAGTLGAVSSQDIHTVILVGPDHYERSTTPIATSTYNWDSPFGTVGCGAKIIHELLKQDYVGEYPEVLEYEHSVSGIIPYIRYFFPNAKVVPLIVRPDVDGRILEEISGTLENILEDSGAFMVSAVDFSHYLTSEQAEENNMETLRVMREREYGTLRSFDQDYIDSPESIEIFLRTMDDVGANKLEVLYNTDSGVLIGDPYGQTTSYFGIVAY